MLVAIMAGGAGFAFYGLSAPGPSYVTAPVERGIIVTVVEATGRVAAVNTVDVSSQLSGQIAKVFVGFNDRVKAGQPLAELDRSIFQAHVAEAQAAVAVAKAEVRVREAAIDRAKLAATRARTDRTMAQDQAEGARAHQTEAEQEFRRKLELTRSGSASASEVGRARAARDTAAADLRAGLDQVSIKQQAIAMSEVEVKMAAADLANVEAVVAQRQAAFDRARLDLDRTVLRSPIDGVVVKRDVNPGQTVAVTLEAKTLFTIANDLRRMEVHGKIDEADIGRVKVGQTVRFTVDAYPEETFSGTVLQLRKAPESKEGVVTYTAIISAGNPDLRLFPGMTATLRITANRTKQVLKVPAAALRFRPRGGGRQEAPLQAAAVPGARATVWIPGADGQPVPVAVSIGRADKNGAEIRSGKLTEGQRVILGAADRPSGSEPFGARLGF